MRRKDWNTKTAATLHKFTANSNSPKAGANTTTHKFATAHTAYQFAGRLEINITYE